MIDSSIQFLINRYKQMRSRSLLCETYKKQYALVGLGNHSLSNLLPVIQHLQMPLKYICCTSKEKAELTGQKYVGVKGTHSLREILEDRDVAGVIVATSPSTHFTIASEVLNASKSLFIEKPPCENTKELNALLNLSRQHQGKANIVVGLQKRFAPCTHLLKQAIKQNPSGLHSYHYRYLTGLYPEGDPLLDLFIHPIDHATWLFGKPQVKSISFIEGREKGGLTIFLVLQHENITGLLELSTCYSWQDSRETLEINATKGLYALKQMSKLTFTPRQKSIMGIPLEKVYRKSRHQVVLYETNPAIPVLANNPIVSQGYFAEIKAFANLVEGKSKTPNEGKLDTLKETYRIIDEIKGNRT